MISVFQENQCITEALHNFIERKMKQWGSSEYAYTVVNKKNPSKLLIISSYPDAWVDIYRNNNFQQVDPVVLTAFRRTSPFSWDENITLMSDLKFKRIFSLSKQYNIVNGFTFVLHDHHNNLAMLSIIIDANVENGFESRISAERGALQMLLIEFNEQMYRLIESVTAGNQQGKAGSDKAIFSPRENEVLYWASMGKTYPEIASIANIAVRTVKFHMKNVVSKLGVSNARQAIRVASELALIITEK